MNANENIQSPHWTVTLILTSLLGFFTSCQAEDSLYLSQVCVHLSNTLQGRRTAIV